VTSQDFNVADGDWAQIDSSASAYLTARAGFSLLATAQPTYLTRVGQWKADGGDYKVHQAFWAFNLSAMDVGAAVSSAALAFVGTNEGSEAFTIELRQANWRAIDTGDWVAGADLGEGDILATWDTAVHGAISTSPPGSEFQENGAALRAAIAAAAGGWLELMATTKEQRTASAPATEVGGYVALWTNHPSSGLNNLILSVTWTPPVHVTVESVAATAQAAAQIPTFFIPVRRPPAGSARWSRNPPAGSAQSPHLGGAP